MGLLRRKPKYAKRDPHAGPWTTCDVCGFIWSKNDMAFQHDYQGGSVPVNLGTLSCPKCLHPLTLQKKLIILPPDPPPFFNLRPDTGDDAGDFDATGPNLLSADMRVSVALDVAQQPGGPDGQWLFDQPLQSGHFLTAFW